MYESWIGLAGLIVAIFGILLTLSLRLYDYRKQASQRRLDRIGNALRKLQPKLVLAKLAYGDKDVPSTYSAIEQVYQTLVQEIMYEGLSVDLKLVSQILSDKLGMIYALFFAWQGEYKTLKEANPDKARAYFDTLREKVVNDMRIKGLIEELVPMVNDWLAKHP